MLLVVAEWAFADAVVLRSETLAASSAAPLTKKVRAAPGGKEDEATLGQLLDADESAVPSVP